MKKCPQTDSQNVYEHGISVWEYSKKLISGQWDNFRIPDSFRDNHVAIVNNMVDMEKYKRYVIYHDCGKPYCLEYDETGRKHFPNHAEHSSTIWSNLYPDDVIVSSLMKLDMVLHTNSIEQLKELNLDIQIGCTLIISALSELHSNANMFGGIESTSFKIKYKALDKRIKFLCKLYFSP